MGDFAKTRWIWGVGVLALVAIAWPVLAGADCSKVEEYANNAVVHAKRLYHSDSLDDARFYAQNLMQAAQDTRKAAVACDCRDAEAFAEETYKYAVKAKGARTLEDAQSLAQDAIESAEDALESAVVCND